MSALKVGQKAYVGLYRPAKDFVWEIEITKITTHGVFDGRDQFYPVTNVYHTKREALEVIVEYWSQKRDSAQAVLERVKEQWWKEL